jgi:5-amino-6-(5-phosphoribosylamino)uracil reductase
VTEPLPRPYAEVVLALSIDGHIADGQRSPTRLGSAADRAHLDQRIASADAVLFGASTLRSVGHALRVNDRALLADRLREGLTPQPIQIVASRRGDIPDDLPFFTEPAQRWLATTSVGAKAWIGRSGFTDIVVADDADGGVDWTAGMAALFARGLQRICVLGGGDLVASLVSANLIDQFWLTICPVLVGGAGAPTALDGPDRALGSLPGVHLVSAQQVGQELYLNYRVGLTRSG